MIVYECLDCHYIFPENQAESKYGWLACPNEDCGGTELQEVVNDGRNDNETK